MKIRHDKDGTPYIAMEDKIAHERRILKYFLYQVHCTHTGMIRAEIRTQSKFEIPPSTLKRIRDHYRNNSLYLIQPRMPMIGGVLRQDGT